MVGERDHAFTIYEDDSIANELEYAGGLLSFVGTCARGGGDRFEVRPLDLKPHIANRCVH